MIALGVALAFCYLVYEEVQLLAVALGVAVGGVLPELIRQFVKTRLSDDP